MMKRLISLMVIISHFMLVTAPAAAAIREEAVCRKLSYVCVDGPSTKNINGVEITKDCWEYKAEYQCLEKDPADYCAPLKNRKQNVRFKVRTVLRNLKPANVCDTRTNIPAMWI